MFKIIGAAAAAANLLCEFKIAEKKEAKDTNIKNGKVILVRLIASSILSTSLIIDNNDNDNNEIIKTFSGIDNLIEFIR